MKKHILVFALLFSVLVVVAQEDKPTPYPDFIGKELTAIESNPNWNVLKKTIGDLNKDSINDMVLVIESKENFIEIRCADCNTSENKARIILVLLHTDDKLTVDIQNNEFIPRSDEGGMSAEIEPDITIENNQLTIYQQYTRSSVSYTFAFQEGTFNIVSSENNNTHATSGDTETIVFDFSKSEITITRGNISDEGIESEQESEEENEVEKKEKVTVIKFDKKAKPLSEFKAMFEWEIAEYYNL